MTIFWDKSKFLFAFTVMKLMTVSQLISIEARGHWQTAVVTQINELHIYRLSHMCLTLLHMCRTLPNKECVDPPLICHRIRFKGHTDVRYGWLRVKMIIQTFKNRMISHKMQFNRNCPLYIRLPDNVVFVALCHRNSEYNSAAWAAVAVMPSANTHCPGSPNSSVRKHNVFETDAVSAVHARRKPR